MKKIWCIWVRTGFFYMDEVEYKIKEIVSKQLGIQISKISNNFSIKNDLGADSLDIIELIISLEKAFGIEVSDEEINKIITVRDSIDYIKKLFY